MGHPRWVKHPVHTVRWNPNDHTQLCVMGPHVFLQYKLQSSVKHQESSVTSLVTLLNKEEKFTTFTYLPQHADAMVVCKMNKILVLNRGIVIQSLDISNVLSATPSGSSTMTNQYSANQPHISTVCATEKGFAIGTSIHEFDEPYPAETSNSNSKAVANLLIYEFPHTRTLDLTPTPDFVSGGRSKQEKDQDRVISTTLFDRARIITQEANQALQAFRTKCIPLWRTQTGTNKSDIHMIRQETGIGAICAPLMVFVAFVSVIRRSGNFRSLSITSPSLQTTLALL
jgi:hypothetical protein